MFSRHHQEESLPSLPATGGEFRSTSPPVADAVPFATVAVAAPGELLTTPGVYKAINYPFYWLEEHGCGGEGDNRLLACQHHINDPLPSSLASL